MAKKRLFFSFAVLLLTAIFILVGCDTGTDGNEEQGTILPGQIGITPVGPVAEGTQLFAVYIPGGSEQVTFQWKKGTSNVTGTPGGVPNTSSYTPDSPGNYSVIVSADGFRSKTSNVVSVTENGGDGPGTIVASKYRGSYPEHGSERDGNAEGGADTEISTLVVGENTITWLIASTSAPGSGFTGVSTGSDHTMTWALGGTWAYLYSGTAKIGIIYAYSAYGYANPKMVITGHQYVQAFVTTVASSMGITSLDFSDIDVSVKNVSGEITS